MGVHERDPRDIRCAALATAIKWYIDITPEAAMRIVEGQSHAKPGRTLTPEILAEIKKIIRNPNHRNINAVVKKFRINKYEIYEALSGKQNADEEVIIVQKIETDLKKLSNNADKCSGANCDSCILNSILYGEYTLCEILCDLEFDDDGKLVSGSDSKVHKSIQKYTSTDQGKPTPKTYKVYDSILHRTEKYIGEHPERKQQDIISEALFEYLERRKVL
jgi:hypothetical protein